MRPLFLPAMLLVGALMCFAAWAGPGGNGKSEVGGKISLNLEDVKKLKLSDSPLGSTRSPTSGARSPVSPLTADSTEESFLDDEVFAEEERPRSATAPALPQQQSLELVADPAPGSSVQVSEAPGEGVRVRAAKVAMLRLGARRPINGIPVFAADPETVRPSAATRLQRFIKLHSPRHQDRLLEFRNQLYYEEGMLPSEEDRLSLLQCVMEQLIRFNDEGPDRTVSSWEVNEFEAILYLWALMDMPVDPSQGRQGPEPLPRDDLRPWIDTEQLVHYLDAHGVDLEQFSLLLNDPSNVARNVQASRSASVVSRLRQSGPSGSPSSTSPRKWDDEATVAQRICAAIALWAYKEVMCQLMKDSGALGSEGPAYCLVMFFLHKKLFRTSLVFLYLVEWPPGEFIQLRELYAELEDRLKPSLGTRFVEGAELAIVTFADGVRQVARRFAHEGGRIGGAVIPLLVFGHQHRAPQAPSK